MPSPYVMMYHPECNNNGWGHDMEERRENGRDRGREGMECVAESAGNERFGQVAEGRALGRGEGRWARTLYTA